FAAAAGLLLAAEGAADLGPARPDVHVDDAAVAAARCHEAIGLAQVGGEDAGGQALRHAVVDGDGVLELAVRHGIEDRGEGLLAHDLRLPWHLHDCRLHVEAVGDLVEPHALAAKYLAAIGRGAAERLLHAFEAGAVDQRADQRARLAGVADLDA